jgi:hypothetical protein
MSFKFKLKYSIHPILTLFGLILKEWRDIFLRYSMRPMQGFPSNVCIQGLVHLVAESLATSQYFLQLVLVVEGIFRLIDIDKFALIFLSSFLPSKTVEMRSAWWSFTSRLIIYFKLIHEKGTYRLRNQRFYSLSCPSSPAKKRESFHLRISCHE